jgi:hypothetical protein
MSYKTIWLTNVESLTPLAAQKLQDFADAGGSVVFIGDTPRRSLSFKDAETNDRIVKDAMQKMLIKSNVLEIPVPKESDDFMNWTRILLKKISLEPAIKISDAASYLYTLKKAADDKDILFFVNAHRNKEVDFKVDLKTQDKFPTIWIPATGKRFAYPITKNKNLQLRLNPLESALIILEPVDQKLPVYTLTSPQAGTKSSKLNATWDVKFEHINGTTFSHTMEDLMDFKDAKNEAIRTFAGTVFYTTILEKSDNINSLLLKNVNEAVTELFVNGKSAGMNWYGRHQYDVSKLCEPGPYKIEIKLTTTLANYCMSIKDNPTAQAWTGRYKGPFSSGLLGVEIVE